MISIIQIAAYALSLVLTSAGFPQSSSAPPSSTSSTSAPTGTAGSFSDARMTWYNASLGACGQNNTDADFIVAMNPTQFGGGASCNKTITITYNGKSRDADVKDLCPACPSGGLDLTPTLFAFFADLGTGHVQGEWKFKDGGGSSSQAGSSYSQGTSPGGPATTGSTTSVPTTTSTPPPSSASTSSASVPGVITSQSPVPGATTTSPTLAPGAENSPTIAPGAENSPSLPAGATATRR